MAERMIETQAQLSEWVREQFQRANKYLAEQGILFETVVTEESRYLAPHVALWKIKSTDGEFFWVTSGEVICDVMPAETEATARAAMKNFSFKWQLEAENLLRSNVTSDEQKSHAQSMIKNAETLYQVQAKDELWV